MRIAWPNAPVGGYLGHGYEVPGDGEAEPGFYENVHAGLGRIFPIGLPNPGMHQHVMRPPTQTELPAPTGWIEQAIHGGIFRLPIFYRPRRAMLAPHVPSDYGIRFIGGLPRYGRGY